MKNLWFQFFLGEDLASKASGIFRQIVSIILLAFSKDEASSNDLFVGDQFDEYAAALKAARTEESIDYSFRQPSSTAEQQFYSLLAKHRASIMNGNVSEEFDRYMAYSEEDPQLIKMTMTPHLIDAEFVLDWWKVSIRLVFVVRKVILTALIADGSIFPYHCNYCTRLSRNSRVLCPLQTSVLPRQACGYRQTSINESRDVQSSPNYRCIPSR